MPYKTPHGAESQYKNVAMHPLEVLGDLQVAFLDSNTSSLLYDACTHKLVMTRHSVELPSQFYHTFPGVALEYLKKAGHKMPKSSK